MGVCNPCGISSQNEATWHSRLEELELKLPKIHKDDLDESYRDDKQKIQHDLFVRPPTQMKVKETCSTCTGILSHLRETRNRNFLIAIRNLFNISMTPTQISYL